MDKPETVLASEIPPLRSEALAPNLAVRRATSIIRGRQDASGRPYAGFWVRFLAYLIDGVIVTVVMSAIYGLVYFGLSASFLQLAGGAVQVTLNFGEHPATLSNATVVALAFVPGLLDILYLAMMESSRYQASYGKLAVGLKVTDVQGRRISFGRAIGRELGKIISCQTFCIGFMVAGFAERKQGLHDIIARTLVVSSRKA
jgi:uncharacterized RDD family membrane protein YckC